MGGAGHWPAPVGDPPTGTGAAAPTSKPSPLFGNALPVPSGESPDGTGQWPVLPSQEGGLFPEAKFLADDADAGNQVP